MFDSGRSRVPQSRLLIAFILVAVATCSVAWVYYGHIHRAERENAAHEYQEKSFVKCVSTRGFVAVSECFSESQEAAYEQSADYYDLKAQQDMAKWALLMFVVTAVGVFYVALTLEAAKEANNVARDIGIAQVRAYISVLSFEFSGNPTRFTVNTVTGESRSAHTVELHARNDGQTPARNVRILGDIIVKPFIEGSQNSIHLRHYDQEFFDVTPNDRLTLRQPGGAIRLSKDEAINVASGSMRIHVEIDIWYEDVVSKIERRTPAHFLCRWDTKEGWVIENKPDNRQHT